jgi:hypothetical protein
LLLTLSESTLLSLVAVVGHEMPQVVAALEAI